MQTKNSPPTVEQINLLSNLPNISREPRFRVKVLENKKITKYVITLTLERPTNFTFNPSQYIWLVLPELSTYTGIIDRRAYSIASGSDDSEIVLLIVLTESDFLNKVKSLKVGQEVDIIGPMGSSFIPTSDKVIMITGGMGMAPLLSIVRSHKLKHLCIIAYSRKDKEPLHFETELRDISARFDYKNMFKRTGPIESDFKHICTKIGHEQIFICGSQGFVNLVTSLLIKNGISPKRLRYEQNYPQSEVDKRLEDKFTDFFYGDFSNEHQQLPGLGDLFLQAMEQTSNHIILTDRHGRILFANKGATVMTGYSFAEMQGQTPRLWGGLMPGIEYKEMWSKLKKGLAIKKTVVNRRRDGSLYNVIATITPILHKSIYMATEENITSLIEIDKAKTEFVSVASHQLRTPLSIVKWYIEMLTSGDLGELTEKQNQYLNEIYNGNERMVELVNTLLDLSRLELGTLAIVREKTNLLKLAKSMIDELQPAIEKKKLNLSFKFEKDIPEVMIDPKLFRMVGLNLLSNSIKYTPDNGNIGISLSMSTDNKILIKISDNGYGIPTNQQSSIFSKFFRADNVRLKNTEGTGLGLYIAKLIVENYKGKIWFNSEEDKGTTFYISLPVKNDK